MNKSKNMKTVKQQQQEWALIIETKREYEQKRNLVVIIF